MLVASYLFIKKIASTAKMIIKPAITNPACTSSFLTISLILFIPDFLKIKNNNQVFQETLYGYSERIGEELEVQIYTTDISNAS